MRASRVIAILFLLFCALLLGIVLWTILTPANGRMATFAAARIQRICGFNPHCSVKMADLFEGDWDTFYEFGAGVSQSEMNQVLGSSRVLAGNTQRTFALVRDRNVIAAEHVPFGASQPLDGEIEFEDERHREQRIVRYSRDTIVRVTAFPTDATTGHGTFYVLSEDD